MIAAAPPGQRIWRPAQARERAGSGVSTYQKLAKWGEIPKHSTVHRRRQGHPVHAASRGRSPSSHPSYKRIWSGHAAAATYPKRRRCMESVYATTSWWMLRNSSPSRSGRGTSKGGGREIRSQRCNPHDASRCGPSRQVGGLHPHLFARRVLGPEMHAPAGPPLRRSESFRRFVNVECGTRHKKPIRRCRELLSGHPPLLPRLSERLATTMGGARR